MGLNPVCNRGAAAEADAIGRAAAEVGAIGEQQLEAEAKGEQQCRNRAREQQLKRTQAASSMQLKWTQSGRSSSSESCPAPDYAR